MHRASEQCITWASITISLSLLTVSEWVCECEMEFYNLIKFQNCYILSVEKKMIPLKFMSIVELKECLSTPFITDNIHTVSKRERERERERERDTQTSRCLWQAIEMCNCGVNCQKKWWPRWIRSNDWCEFSNEINFLSLSLCLCLCLALHDSEKIFPRAFGMQRESVRVRATNLVLKLKIDKSYISCCYQCACNMFAWSTCNQSFIAHTLIHSITYTHRTISQETTYASLIQDVEITFTSIIHKVFRVHFFFSPFIENFFIDREALKAVL
jgi:hypothetical protein